MGALDFRSSRRNIGFADIVASQFGRIHSNVPLRSLACLFT